MITALSLAFLLPLAPALGAPRKQPAARPLPPLEKIVIKTTDGWTLSGEYRPPGKWRPVAVMVHGYAAGKGEWAAFADALAKKGWGTLALDLRGHGESLAGPRGKTTLEIVDSENAWPAAREDIDAAIAFLENKKFALNRIGLLGASLGANLVSQAARRKPKLRFAVLLSPGRDYRGVLLEERVGPKTLAAASASDPYAFQTLVGLRARAGSHVLLQAEGGHGVQMFGDPVFLKKLLDWLGR